MIRFLIIGFIALCIMIFMAAMGSGMGYASGGGEVRILSSWSEAHSNTGQAIAIQGDHNSIVTDSSPQPVTAAPSRVEAFAPMGLLLLVCVIVLALFYDKFKPYMNTSDNDVSTQQTSGTEKPPRRYG